MEEKDNYIFNLDYKLKNDKDRILLINNKSRNENFILYFVHPIYAKLLSTFDGSTNLKNTLIRISKDFGIGYSNALELIAHFIENDKEIGFKYDGGTFKLPEHLIVRNINGEKRNDFGNLQILSSHMDFSRRRLSIPINMLFCINLKCFTNCIYCYADKNTKHDQISANKWVELIYECKALDIQSIDITGGEFFINPDWEKIAKALTDCGYQPEISTKVPLSDENIDKIARSGLQNIQFSLDTLDEDLAIKTLHVKKGYIQELLRTIRHADKIGLNIIIKPSLDKDTCTKENVIKILDFTKSLQNIKRCVVTIIGYSRYKSMKNYEEIKPSLQSINEINSIVNQYNSISTYPVINDNYMMYECKFRNYSEFINRSTCTANIDGMVVLPDGKVTICEELYWNRDFIIGNLNRESIIGVWNSDKATCLWKLKQADFPVESACSTCQAFQDCRLGKGVCWKLILAAYGKNGKFLPDPRCPKSPFMKYRCVAD